MNTKKKKAQSGYNLWGVFPTRGEAMRAANSLWQRTHQSYRVRKFPKKRSYGVYVH